ncbi:MAG: hypothetical protein IMW99_10670 [Firmicutes bacterium]|nr:hypothetical protein [Bacillota bacterium]
MSLTYTGCVAIFLGVMLLSVWALPEATAAAATSPARVEWKSIFSAAEKTKILGYLSGEKNIYLDIHAPTQVSKLMDAGQIRFVLTGKASDGSGPGLLVLDQDLQRLYFGFRWDDGGLRENWPDKPLRLHWVGADLTGDGRPELIVQWDNSIAGSLRILVNRGNGFVPAAVSIEQFTIPEGRDLAVRLINAGKAGVYALEFLADTRVKGSVIKYVNGQFQVMDPKP